MFEKLKELFCIHKLVIISSTVERGGLLIRLYCTKCGNAKAKFIKHPKLNG